MSDQKCPNCHYPIPQREKPGQGTPGGTLYHPAHPEDMDSETCAQCFYQSPAEPQNEECPQCFYTPDKPEE